MVGLAFFDPTIDRCEKEQMRQNLSIRSSGSNSGKKRITLTQVSDLHLSDLVNENTRKLFTIMDLKCDFLESNVDYWQNFASYDAAFNAISNLRIVNDVAERAVALAQTLNPSLPKDPEKCQGYFHVVENDRK